jgi:hypothetical protein
MLTVATWNLENVFRPGAASGPTSLAAYKARPEHFGQQGRE